MTPEPRPRPHQTQALDALQSVIGEGGRAQLVAACGTGKTLVGRWFAERVAAEATLVLLPSLALVAQTLQEWRATSGWLFEAMVICSDPTTSAGVDERVSADGGDVEPPFWSRHRAQVTTRLEPVRQLLARRRAGRPVVIFSTYHSVAVAAQAARDDGLRFDLVVADEAHHLAGWPREEFRAVLDNRALPARRRLFMTATQVTTPAVTVGEMAWSGLSMEDEELFGPVAYRLGFAEAIDQGLLADYEVVVFETAGGTAPDPLSALLAASGAGLRSVLTFHGRVQKARAFAAAVDGATLPDGRRVVARAVGGVDPVAHRRRVLTLLADPDPDQMVVVSSARCLAEGVDVPAVDGVLFADPKNSEVDVVQALGRALRLHPAKTRGLVMVPVCLPAGIDEDTAFFGTPFSSVWRILRGLRRVDSRLDLELESPTLLPSSRRGVADGSRPGPRVRFELPSMQDLTRLALRMADLTSSTWELWWSQLAEHAATSGAVRPAVSTPLGQWSERQRVAYRRGLLPSDRASRLCELPGWVWDLAEQRWLDQWSQVLGMARRSGRLDLTNAGSMDVRLVVPDRRSRVTTVGRWCAWQRVLARRGELELTRRQLLQEVPGWSWRPLTADDEGCADLLGEYAAWKKDANPPPAYVEEGQPVGRWLNTVRRRRVTGHLPRPVLDELEVLCGGVPVEGRLRWYRPETMWFLGFEALRRFVDREGHCRIPDGHVEALPDLEVPLSVWCRRQRHRHRYGHLGEQRSALIAGVPGWVWEVQPAPRVLMEIGDIRHGSRTGYVKGCRCEQCTEANRKDHADRIAGERSCDWVDAARARGHLRVLAGQGAAKKTLARACGLNVKTIEGLLEGSTGRILPGTEQAVLRCTMATVRAAGRLQPAEASWKLLDELVDRGWPKSWIARELGLGRSLQLSHVAISTSNAAKVARLHRRLDSLQPPPRTWRAELPPLAALEAELKLTG